MTTDDIDLQRVIESDTDTITDAVSSGQITLEDLDRFVRDAEHGEVDAEYGVDSVVWIVRSLLRTDRPGWEEMEPATPAVGS